MPDISMCKKQDCPSFAQCYRAQAAPNEPQVYNDFDNQGESCCDDYIPVAPTWKQRFTKIMHEFEIGAEVWTDFNGKWQKVTLTGKQYGQCQGGVMYTTSPHLGGGGYISIGWFHSERPKK